MKIKNRRMIIKAATITAVLLVMLSVAFAALSTTLNINFSTITQNALTWNVGFKGSKVTPTSEGTSDTGLSCGIATVTPSTVTIADSTLSKPDDKCTYPLTIENTGDISANLAAIAMSQPTNMSCSMENSSTMVCGNITIKLKTKSGVDFTAGVTIEPGEEYALTLSVHYTGTTLNSTPVTINSSKVTFAYKQAAKRTSSVKPDGIKDAPQAVCKRATTLHTEECTRTIPSEIYFDWELEHYATSNGCYSAGYYEGGSKNTTTITYGNLGTTGTLTSGDAFDCDVNGDGVYNPDTERFYYISGIDGDPNSDYAVLLQYTNVSGANPSNSAMFAYDSSNVNYNGPITAYQALPTEAQWPNVKLTNKTRQIYAETGETYVTGWSKTTYQLPVFTYTDKAARLLSYKEVNVACEINVNDHDNRGELKNCEYLMEHTDFVYDNYNTLSPYYWIETPSSEYQIRSFLVNGLLQELSASNNDNRRGVRPAIEVPLTDIEY